MSVPLTQHFQQQPIAKSITKSGFVNTIRPNESRLLKIQFECDSDIFDNEEDKRALYNLSVFLELYDF